MKKKGTDFQPPPSAQVPFIRALRRVAKAASHIVETHVDGHKIKDLDRMNRALREYSELIGPWAERQSAKMMNQVLKLNRNRMIKNSNEIQKALRLNVAEAQVGRVAKELMREQVDLIKSIPLKAGKRAQDLALEAIYDGTRADAIAEELLRTQDVSESTAILIGRTETARANSVITQARAEAVGSKGYIWRTSMDGAERPAHAAMNKKLVSYDDPPTLIDGTTGHAGTFPNCRCWQDVVFDD